jgi:hypothetical protein
MEPAVDAAVAALALALIRLGLDEAAGPELERVFVAFGQIARGGDVGRPCTSKAMSGKASLSRR